MTMDPSTFAEFYKLGPVVTLLIIAILWFAYRDRRTEKRGESRHRACEERNKELSARIETLEDHLVNKYADLAERGFTGLDRVNGYLKRLLQDPVTPPHPLPTIDKHS